MLDHDKENLQDVWFSALRTVFESTARYQRELIHARPGGFFVVERELRVDLSLYEFLDLKSGQFIEIDESLPVENLANLLTTTFIQEKTYRPHWLIDGYFWGWKWVATNHRFMRATRHGLMLVFD